MQNVNQLMQQDPLVRLIQKDNFVGWVYALDYDTARVMTNDLWKAQVQGVPLNCFLIAATFDPEAFSQVPEADREVLLMRVVGSASLPQDDDMVRTKISTSNCLTSPPSSTVLPVAAKSTPPTACASGNSSPKTNPTSLP